MSCTRGCVGTPICSALDICCIQFRQDCGAGCGGLAEGYSRIQLDVDGNLVVCSNVGGVCTCVQGDTGCSGIDPDDCNALECRDDGKYVPSTFFVAESAETDDFVFYAAPGPGPGVHADVLETEIVVNNPSDCCDMEAIINYGAYQLFVDSSTGGVTGYTQLGRWQLFATPHFQLNGADLNFGPVTNAGQRYLLELPSIALGLGDQAEYANEVSTSDWQTSTVIPAGGAITVRSSVDYEVIDWNNLWQSAIQAGSLNVFGACSG